MLIAEPSVDSILRGLDDRYELHHGVRIKDAAIIAAATLIEPVHHRSFPAGRRSILIYRLIWRMLRMQRSLPVEIDGIVEAKSNWKSKGNRWG